MRLPDDLEAVVGGQDRGQRLGEETVVVCDQDADLGRNGFFLDSTNFAGFWRIFLTET